MKKELKDILMNTVVQLLIERNRMLIRMNEDENQEKETETKCLKELDKVIDNIVVCLSTFS